jgi:periplasmic protein TonB
MDRARVIAPSVSFAAHVGGVTFLALGLAVLPDRLPVPARGGFDGLAVSRSFAVSLGGGGPLRGGHSAPPRVLPTASQLTVPAVVPSSLPVPALEVGDGGGVAGLPDGVGGDGTGAGLCLSNCEPGDGAGLGAGAALPALDPLPAPVRIRQGGDLREPVKVRHVAPEYPALAVAARVEGRVVLDCVIDQDGRVSSLTVLKSHPLLEPAALAAVQQWRYRPTLLNGTPVSVLLTVTVEFRLR